MLKALRSIVGVQDVQINLASETATIHVDDTFKTEDAATALDTAGYPAEIKTHRFSIENMSCASCVGRVERALALMPGVVSAVVNLAKEEATLRVLGTSVLLLI